MLRKLSIIYPPPFNQAAISFNVEDTSTSLPPTIATHHKCHAQMSFAVYSNQLMCVCVFVTLTINHIAKDLRFKSLNRII